MSDFNIDFPATPYGDLSRRALAKLESEASQLELEFQHRRSDFSERFANLSCHSLDTDTINNNNCENINLNNKSGNPQEKNGDKEPIDRETSNYFTYMLTRCQEIGQLIKDYSDFRLQPGTKKAGEESPSSNEMEYSENVKPAKKGSVASKKGGKTNNCGQQAKESKLRLTLEQIEDKAKRILTYSANLQYDLEQRNSTLESVRSDLKEFVDEYGRQRESLRRRCWRVLEGDIEAALNELMETSANTNELQAEHELEMDITNNQIEASIDPTFIN